MDIKLISQEDIHKQNGEYVRVLFEIKKPVWFIMKKILKFDYLCVWADMG